MISLKNLAPQTEKVLLELSEYEYLKDFIFVGGSALAVYYKHRLSEDIDLFTWKDSIQVKFLNILLNTHFVNKFEYISMDDIFTEIILDNVRVTFFANNWNVLNQGDKLSGHLTIAPIELLTAMKINTLFLRSKFRDYYDLFYINQNTYSVSEMYEIALKYIPGINKKLFQMALLYTNDITEEKIDHLNPSLKLSIKDIQKHFEKQLSSWNGEK